MNAMYESEGFASIGTGVYGIVVAELFGEVLAYLIVVLGDNDDFSVGCPALVSCFLLSVVLLFSR